MENLNIQDEEKMIGDGENETPLKKVEDSSVEIRTMASDINSLEQSGGENVKPYQPQENYQTENQENEKQVIDLNQGTNEQEVINISQGLNQENLAGQNISSENFTKPLSKNKKIFSVIVIVLVVLILMAVGYFFVYPLVFSPAKNLYNQENQEQEVVTNQPTVPLQNFSPTLPEEFNQDNQTDETSLNQEEQNQELNQEVGPLTETLKTVDNYQSFLKQKADAQEEIKLTYATLAHLRKQIPFAKSEAMTLKEIILKNTNEQVIALEGLMSLIAPDFFNSERLSYFEDNFNVFSYLNQEGTWFVFLLKLRPEAKVSEIQDQMALLQKSTNLKNFFLTDVGEIGNWQDYLLRNKPTSLVDFSYPGASLSYTWLDKYLLLSTNKNAAEEVAKRLGF